MTGLPKDPVVDAVETANVLYFPSRAAPADAGAGGSPASGGSAEPAAAGGGSAAAPAGPTRERSAFAGARKPPNDGDDDRDNLDRRLAFVPLTDLGNAKRFHERNKGMLLYCDKFGWFAWDGRRWNAEMADAYVQLAEHRTVEAIQHEAEWLAGSTYDEIVQVKGTKKEPIEIWQSDKIAAWGRMSECGAHLTAMSKNAQALFQVPPSALDSHPMKLNVLNGTLHFDKAHDGYVTLLPPDPNDFITKLAPIDYDPKAECPLYDAFLARVQPEPAMRRFLHQWGGLSLTGETGEQKLTFHYGKGRNGKGVWVSTVKNTIGDYASAIRIESFLDSGRAQAGGQATPDLAKLPGVRFLSTSEPKKGAVLDEGLVKLFTGEDTISARHLNKGFFDFQPCAKLTMQGNYRPRISGTDEGIWNRMTLVPWGVFIPKADRDRHLAQKLRAEGSGILNRLVDGLRDWFDHGLVVPEEVEKATAEYRSDSDPLGCFLESCTEQAMGERVQSSDMHALFAAWAKANGETEWTAKGLSLALKERGVASKKSDTMFWLDIKLTKHVRDFVDEHGKAHRTAESGGDDSERWERVHGEDEGERY